MEKEFPLQWPEGQPRTAKRQKAKFNRNLTQARQHLTQEIARLGATDVVISSNYGGLAGRNPEDPGVAVYFNRRGKRLAMACDSWTVVTDNLNAIGNTIEAIRGIERWGCGHLMERAFSAFEALPPPATGWRAVMGFAADATLDIDAVEKLYRIKAKNLHPDAPNGSAEKFRALTDARDEARKELS